ncbi:MAG: histidine kinase [Desulfuromonas sp.]|nr:MAG: histidine kinase [Desulfuromonas sp.]
MHKIVIIDDDRHFLDLFTSYIRERYPLLEVVAFSDQVKSLPEINHDINLLLIDLEMPGLDGTKLLRYACEKGLSKSRIIILSGHDAEYLHDKIPMGECLAVLNKHEARQKEVLDMVFNAIQKREGA